ncbi:MAG: dipeptide epimerase [Betaproteobacteria bacterium]|nr:dipeptide epimerase [Betaproteobacteria bacterium]
MTLTEISAGEIRVPLTVPFKTAVRTVDHMHSLILTVKTDDGRTGWGEAPATAVITGDLIDSMRAGLAVLAPRLIGRDLGDFNACLNDVESGLAHHSSLKAALEMALFDLRAQAFGVPLYQLLGGGKPQLKTDVTISVNDIDSMVADSRRAVAAGFDALKIKTGGRDWRIDVDAVRAIHAAVGPNVALRVDANQGWSPKAAVAALGAIAAAGIDVEFVEQPVKADDLAGLKFVTDHVAAPVLADEAVFSVKDALAVLSSGSADILNIKLMKTGGLLQAIEIARLARRHHRPCMIGCMLEGVISVTAAAHFAAAYADVVTLVDLDGPALCRERRVRGGLVMEGPWITLPQSPGLGIEAVDGMEKAQSFR